MHISRNFARRRPSRSPPRYTRRSRLRSAETRRVLIGPLGPPSRRRVAPRAVHRERHRVSAEISLRLQLVMRSTEQANVLGGGLATPRMGLSVMKLQATALDTPATLSINERALLPVPRCDDTLHAIRNVPASPPRRPGLVLRPFCLGPPLRFEPSDQLVESVFEHVLRIAPAHTHQLLSTQQFVAELFARRELNLEPRLAEWCHGTLRWGWRGWQHGWRRRRRRRRGV